MTQNNNLASAFLLQEDCLILYDKVCNAQVTTRSIDFLLNWYGISSIGIILTVMHNRPVTAAKIGNEKKASNPQQPVNREIMST